MFPIGDDNSDRLAAPVVTPILIGINVLVYLLEMASGDAFILKWAFIPANFTADPAGNVVTILTAMFMHGGLFHLFGNMLFLWIFGDNVEYRVGPVKFLLFYLLSGVAGTLAQYALMPHATVPNLGASGAIAGVLGAYILMFPKKSVNVLLGPRIVIMPAIVVIGAWIGLQLISGAGTIYSDDQANVGGVAYMAHIGGFFAGLLMAVRLRNATPPATTA